MTAAGDLRRVPPRSLLFVPADKALELLPKAHASGADAIILDLEDAVLPERRAAARSGLAAACAAASPSVPVFVRVSGAGTPAFELDVKTAAGLGDVGVVLPKCDGPGDVQRLVRTWRALTSAELVVIPIIETARGLFAAAAIAAADPAVIGLAFGAEDLGAEVGFPRTAVGDEILVARSLVVLAATAGGAWAIDTPNLELRRPDVVLLDARRAASLGFVGKLLVHPAQVAPVHAAFQPSAAEMERAHRTIESAERLATQGRGVGSVDGTMIDEPVVEAARRLLARAARFAAGGAP